MCVFVCATASANGHARGAVETARRATSKLHEEVLHLRCCQTERMTDSQADLVTEADRADPPLPPFFLSLAFAPLPVPSPPFPTFLPPNPANGQWRQRLVNIGGGMNCSFPSPPPPVPFPPLPSRPFPLPSPPPSCPLRPLPSLPVPPP